MVIHSTGSYNSFSSGLSKKKSP
uniref:Uncharacterized protein n=1 Tax=Arundo donax TaxID=35708 RepID=A0A0A8XRJ4_ARUDO